MNYIKNQQLGSLRRTVLPLFLCTMTFFFTVSAEAQDEEREEPNVFSGAAADTKIAPGFFDDIGTIQKKEIIIIQKKFFPKDGRHEITAGMFGGIPFDSFQMSMLGGVAYAYHFNQALAIEPVHVLYARHFDASLTEGLRTKFLLSPSIISPSILMASTLMWSPLYGKVALSQDRIQHYDVYLIGGGGFIVSTASKTPAGVGGIGVRTFVNRWSSFKFEFRGYVYQEKVRNEEANTFEGSTLRSAFLITLGWSIYYPKFQFNPLE